MVDRVPTLHDADGTDRALPPCRASLTETRVRRFLGPDTGFKVTPVIDLEG